MLHKRNLVLNFIIAYLQQRSVDQTHKVDNSSETVLWQKRVCGLKFC